MVIIWNNALANAPLGRHTLRNFEHECRLGDDIKDGLRWCGYRQRRSSRLAGYGPRTGWAAFEAQVNETTAEQLPSMVVWTAPQNTQVDDAVKHLKAFKADQWNEVGEKRLKAGHSTPTGWTWRFQALVEV